MQKQDNKQPANEEQVLEISMKDITDIFFDPQNPLDYASIAGGPIAKGIVSVNKVQKLLDKLAQIQKLRAQQLGNLKRGQAELRVGLRDGYQADITGGQKLINNAQKRLKSLDEQEAMIRKQIPEGTQMEMPFAYGGEVMPLLYN